jgi:hypothetical protein
MSVDNLISRVNGQVIDETWFARMKRAITGVFVPRDVTTLDASDEAGSLGSSTYRFNRAHITSGYLSVGMMKYKYVYTSISPVLEAGWMLCDGRVVSEANYNTEHGANTWASEVVSSPINGLRLPDFNNRYMRGVNGSTQSGASPITSVGNGSLSISHAHGTNYTTGAPNNAGVSRGSIAGVTNFSDGTHSHTFTLTTQDPGGGLDPQYVLLKVYMRVI